MRHITRLEERLASTDAPDLREALSSSLAAIEHRLRTRIAARLPPNEFAQAEALADATAAAQEVLARWPPARNAH